MFVSPVKEQTDSPKNRNTLVDAIYDFNLDAGSTPAISTRPNKTKKAFPSQKSFLCISNFARIQFFLLKNFFVPLCSDEQSDEDDLCLSLGRGRIPPPNPLLPPHPRERNKNLRRQDVKFLCPKVHKAV